jgi:hypothetical protein
LIVVIYRSDAEMTNYCYSHHERVNPKTPAPIDPHRVRTQIGFPAAGMNLQSLNDLDQDLARRAGIGYGPKASNK